MALRGDGRLANLPLMRSALLLSFLLMSSTALADQAYIQASPWVVNRLPVMEGQDFHQRCVVQTSFTGTASVQFIAEGKKLRGAIFILTEPLFKEEGRSMDVTLTAGGKSFEFPAQTISKYAVGIEISEKYEAKFRAALENAELVRLKSGFNTYNFSVQLPKAPVQEALACAPVQAELAAAAKDAVSERKNAMLSQAAAQPPLDTQPPSIPANLTPLPNEVPTPPTPSPVAAPVSPQQPNAPKALTVDATPVAPAPVPQAVAPVQQQQPQRVIIGQDLTKQPLSPKAHIVPKGGKDVVLADAMPTILPEGYTFKMAQGASAGERISWDQGGEWMETLVVALDDIGLQAAVSNKTVTVLPKLKPVTMDVASGQVTPAPRPDVIVKENNIMQVTSSDPKNPPSPGMKDEASALLAKMRLDQESLNALLNQPGTAGEDAANDYVPMAYKDGVIGMQPKIGLSDVSDLPDKEDNVKGPVFAAGKGESLKNVVARWSESAGQPTELELQRDYFLDKPITVKGDYDMAVAQLLGQFKDIPDAPRVSGDNEAGIPSPKKAGGLDTGGASGSVKGAKSAMTEAALEEGDDELPVQQSKAEKEEPNAMQQRLGLVARWEASRNTSLRAALSNWARQSQMQLVWNGDSDLTVPQSLQSTARFEDALEKLLSQYDDAAEQPMVQINRDPDTGMMAMIVDIQKSKPNKK